MIIGVTDEAADLVDEFVEKRKPTYPVVILKTSALEDALGVPHFPFHGVIDTKGNLVYAGNSPEGAIGKSLKDAKAGPLWPKKLTKAAQALRVSKWADAWTELDAVGKDTGLDEREKAVHAKFKAYVEAQASAAFARAKAAAAAGHVWAALVDCEPLAKASPPMPMAEDAQKLVADLRATPKFDLESKGGQEFVEADRLERTRDYLGAAERFKAISKKYPGTQIGPLALQRARDLVGRGMPGFKETCPKCGKAGRACAKHAEEVKL